jgi:hypothetical protein
MSSIPSLSSYPLPATASTGYATQTSFSTAYNGAPAYDSSPVVNPVPEARYLDAPTSTSNHSYLDHQYTAPQSIPKRTTQPTSYAEELAPRVSAAGRFTKPAPSAAAVWRANGSTVVR